MLSALEQISARDEHTYRHKRPRQVHHTHKRDRRHHVAVGSRVSSEVLRYQVECLSVLVDSQVCLCDGASVRTRLISF